MPEMNCDRCHGKFFYNEKRNYCNTCLEIIEAAIRSGIILKQKEPLDREKTKKIILAAEEEIFYIIGDNDSKKAQEIVQHILEELELVERKKC